MDAGAACPDIAPDGWLSDGIMAAMVAMPLGRVGDHGRRGGWLGLALCVRSSDNQTRIWRCVLVVVVQVA